MAVPRYLEKYENSAGTVSYVWPLNAYEWQSSQSLRTPNSLIAGADYAYDLRGSLPGLKALAQERVRFLDVQASTSALETDLDSLRSELWQIGRGKLYVLDSAASRRWAYARLAAMPEMTLGVGMTRHVPVSLQFDRYSDWFATSLTTHTEAVAVSPKTFTVNNPGNAPVTLMTIRLRSSSAAGFTNPLLENLTNGYSWSSTRDAASVNDELKVDTDAMTVQRSTDDGVSYTNDFALFSRGLTQIGYFRLEPGDNSVRYTDGGTPNLDIVFTYYASYH